MKKVFYEVDGRYYNTLEEARKDHYRTNRKIRLHICTKPETIARLNEQLYLPGFCQPQGCTFHAPSAVQWLMAEKRI